MKRRLKKYQKEYEELVNIFVGLTTRHTERLALKFTNDVSKLNEEYEDVLHTEKK